ncbi:MAG: MGMT family protein [Candidatus Promineifilaceae bacterium]
MEPGTPSFYEKVYKVVRCIPPGQVSSYGRIATMLGHPNAARAVGYALSALRHPNQDGYTSANVPWQRVVNSQGRISIRHREQAANKQADLLRAERVTVDENGRIDLATHLWPGLHLIELDDIFRNDPQEP